MKRLDVVKKATEGGEKSVLEGGKSGLDYYLSPREGIVFEMVKEAKYGPVRAMPAVLGEMLAEGILSSSLPDTFDSLVVCPLPTISKHKRERGFDHVELMAKAMTSEMRRRCPNLRVSCRSLLAREGAGVQVGKTATEREKQASGAYRALQGRISRYVLGDSGVTTGQPTVLLMDDVWTTGASMRAAAKVLREAGVKKIVCVAICGGEGGEYGR